MDKNTGNRYEKLTQKLYQQIVDLDTNGYEKIEVKHNVKIKGKSGLEHQIDVFCWEAYKKMVAKVIKGGEINEINI